MTLDVFLNKASYETNEIIKVLTLMTAITTPTLLIGTWYGMNFQRHAGARLSARLPDRLVHLSGQHDSAHHLASPETLALRPRSFKLFPQ